MNAHFLPANDDVPDTPRMEELRRYFACPEYRALVDAERERMFEARHVEIDRQILANFSSENFDCEPGWLCVVRERVAAFETGRAL